jgi:putative transposase
MDKYQNKYRISSSRLQGWDYSQNGVYFITICSDKREYLFGNIEADTMVLSVFGQIINREWNKSFEIRSELFCDAFIIMPNHLHAILRIDNNNCGSNGSRDSNRLNGSRGSNRLNGSRVETHGRASLQSPQTPQTPQSQQAKQFTGVAYRSPKSISSFVAGFKSSVTKHINELRETPKLPVWQSRFHDHIIRNDDEHQRICNYIENNPEKWEQDKFFKSEEL